MGIFEDWIRRQESTVQDFIRRLFRRVDPTAPEPGEGGTPTTPPPATPAEVTGSGVFLWKPKSDSDGNVAVLLPCQYRLNDSSDPWRTATNAILIDGLFVRGGDRDGDRPEKIYRPANDANGRRIHSRWDAPGEDFGKDFHVVARLTRGGEKTWKVDDGAEREG